MKPDGDRFTKHYVQGWNKWIVIDHKFQRDNEVRDWRKKATQGRLPVWKGTESDADNLCALLNKSYRDDDDLITKVERAQVDFKPWQNNKKATRRRTAPAIVPQFKKCECGARYKGDKHCG